MFWSSNRDVISVYVTCCCIAGSARIRVQLSASHSLADVDRAVDAFIDIGRELKVIQ